MDPKDFWFKKLGRYSGEFWAGQPSIFATQIIKYFPPAGALCDLGAGLGNDSRFFADKGYQVLSTDLVLDYARENTPDTYQNIAFQSIDLSQTLPFKPEMFDVVYCHLSLRFFDSHRTQALFDEILDCLRPKGVFALLTNSVNDPETKIFKSIGEDLYLDDNQQQKHYFSLESLRCFGQKYEILLLDDQGESRKDAAKKVHGLIRFIGRKGIKQ